MTTMIINVQGNTEAQKVADALRLMKCVKRIAIQEGDLERIPGLPYTKEERIDAAVKAMEWYRNGEKGMSQRELQQEIASWK